MDPPPYDEVYRYPLSNDQSAAKPLVDLPQQEQPMQFASAPHLQSIPAENTFVAPPHHRRQQQPFDVYGYNQPSTLSEQQQQPQQRPQTCIYDVNNEYQPPIVADPQFGDSYRVHEAVACFVIWCCNCVFGLIAWSLVATAEEIKFTNLVKARRLAKASLVVSICGIVVSVIISAIVVALYLNGNIMPKRFNGT